VAIARELARRGRELTLVARRADRLRELADEIGGQHGVRVEWIAADLTDASDRERLASEVAERGQVVDVLVNNAGMGSGRPDATTRQESRDGHELRFAVNFLAGALLTLRLLGVLRRSAPARIVNVASLGQWPLDFGDVMLHDGYSGTRAYAQSKLAQITWGFELADRLAGDGVTVTSLHPGTYMPTKIVLEQAGRSVDTLETGVESTVSLSLNIRPARRGIPSVRHRSSSANSESATGHSV